MAGRLLISVVPALAVISAAGRTTSRRSRPSSEPSPAFRQNRSPAASCMLSVICQPSSRGRSSLSTSVRSRPNRRNRGVLIDTTSSAGRAMPPRPLLSPAASAFQASASNRGTATRTATPRSGSRASPEPIAATARSKPAAPLTITACATLPKLARYCSRPASVFVFSTRSASGVSAALASGSGRSELTPTRSESMTRSVWRWRMSTVDFHAALPARRSPSGKFNCLTSSVALAVPLAATLTRPSRLLILTLNGPPNA